MKPPDVVTVAVTRADGGLTVVRVIVAEYSYDDLWRLKKRVICNPTPEYIEKLIAKYDWKNGFECVSWEFVPNDFVDENTDRSYRNAWEHVRGRKKPSHNMPKAREIHRVYLRKARLAEFCRLDNDYRLADEANDQEAKARIGAQRQKYRDVTKDPRIEAAQTVEELKALRLDAMVPGTLGIRYMDKLRISPSIKDVVP